MPRLVARRASGIIFDIDEDVSTRLEAIEAKLARLARLEDQINGLQAFALGQREFVFAGTKCQYWSTGGNRPWDNERAVELPIVHQVVSDFAEPAGIIEVGNVLGHYFPIEHRVLDLHEHHRSVTWNEDVRSFRPPEAPGLVVSVSTLEHVGHPHEPDGFRLAVEAILGWLAPGGRLLFTVPLGHNPGVLEYVESTLSATSSVRALRRMTADNLWREVPLKSVRDVKYGQPFPCANAIVVVDARVA